MSNHAATLVHSGTFVIGANLEIAPIPGRTIHVKSVNAGVGAAGFIEVTRRSTHSHHASAATCVMPTAHDLKQRLWRPSYAHFTGSPNDPSGLVITPGVTTAKTIAFSAAGGVDGTPANTFHVNTTTNNTATLAAVAAAGQARKAFQAAGVQSVEASVALGGTTVAFVSAVPGAVTSFLAETGDAGTEIFLYLNGNCFTYSTAPTAGTSVGRVGRRNFTAADQDDIAIGSPIVLEAMDEYLTIDCDAAIAGEITVEMDILDSRNL